MFEDNQEEPTDLYEDMRQLNMLYEELMWENSDVLEFVPDYENNQIIIKNKTMIRKQYYDKFD
tara:strand:- start:262 stop:450 length:189 start_codon:yes stop_codon:yes gene_type:complete